MRSNYNIMFLVGATYTGASELQYFLSDQKLMGSLYYVDRGQINDIFHGNPIKEGIPLTRHKKKLTASYRWRRS